MDDASVPTLAQRLVDHLKPLPSILVAYSGGVDSAVVAAAAVRAKSANGVIAVTADSPSVARRQLRIARRVAKEIGIVHRVLATEELERPEYARNDARRCFYCKQTLYASLQRIVREHPSATILSGTNADDLGDYRPGIEAGRLAGVQTPLADLGLGKQQVRAIARLWGLSVSEQPASPCLSSRVAYGESVTAQKLAMVEAAEEVLEECGFQICRVRYHPGPLARIELPLDDLPRLLASDAFAAIQQRFSDLGFRFTTLDLAGFRSGSLNALVQIGAAASRERSLR